MWTKFVYFGTYQLALILFALVARRLLPPGPSRNRHVFLLAFAYLGGMFFAAHGLRYLSDGGLENQGATSLWSWVSSHGLGSPGPLVWKLFSTSGGLWGGPLAVLLLLFGFLAIVRMPLATKEEIADAGAIALPFSLALCKVGCFAVGCCYGVAGNGLLFITRTWPGQNRGETLFPTQLLDLASYLVLGVILLALHRRQRARGKLVLWFVLLFSLFRFLSELTRGDHQSAPLGLGLSPVQLVVVVGFLSAATALLRPDLLRAILRARSGPPTTSATSDDRATGYVVLILASAVLWLPQALFLPIFAILLVRDRIARQPTAEAAYHTAAFSVGLLWLASYMLPSLIPFLIIAVAAPIATFLAFDRLESADNARLPNPKAG